MTDSKISRLVQQCKQTLADHLFIWLLPTIAIGTLGSIYALVRPTTWQAVQTLLVRNEAVGELDPDGRFTTTDARKAAQETVIEVARNRHVVDSALRQFAAGSTRRRPKDWPTERDIGTLQEEIAVTAPAGAEFGQSDVIYLSIRAGSAEDAVRLNDAICDQLEQRLQLLQYRRAQSVIQELSEKQSLTQQNLDDATNRLEAMEREVGSDLGELRTLNQAGAGDSNLRSGLNQIKNDLRSARSNRTAQQQQLEILLAASQDPETLVATPNRLLESQPGLRRLKEGLVDAELRVASLMGKMNAAHPDVKAALAAAAEIRQNLYRELDTTIRGVRADLQVTEAVIESYEKQLAEVQGRLDRLASLRARYENLVTEVAHRSQQLRESQRALAEAGAAQEASQTSSLIARIDGPDPGDGPVGPSRLMLLLSSWTGGFMVGVGCMLLLTPAKSAMPRVGRRWTDHWASSMLFGRRASDRVVPANSPAPAAPRRRRASDQEPAPPLAAANPPAPDTKPAAP